jgi:hypothetical protein
MAEQEYIPREAAIKATCENCTEQNTCGGSCADTDRLRAIPAADVAPVVRCKDCRKGIPDSEYATAYSCYGIWHKPDWFCAGGVRKDGDGDA